MSKLVLAGKIIGVIIALAIIAAFVGIPLYAAVGYAFGKVAFETAVIILLSYIFFFSAF